MLKMKSTKVKITDDTPATVVGLGELIWDLLPDGKQLGGATTNFAYISSLLGDRSILASRVGDDELGHEARARLERMGIVTDYLQCDRNHPTGTVGVQIDSRGEALFAMNEDSAWDCLEWTEDWSELASTADIVCFGTMAQREPRARETIIRFVEETRPEALRIFDVNLRHAFFTAEMLVRSIELASVVKLNDDELARISVMLGLYAPGELALARQIIEKFDVELVAITRGANGSLLVSRQEDVDHAGFEVDIADTIGAGDAFAAVLAHYYLRHVSLKTISEAANRMGSWVATQVGATPEISKQALARILGDLYAKL